MDVSINFIRLSSLPHTVQLQKSQKIHAARIAVRFFSSISICPSNELKFVEKNFFLLQVVAMEDARAAHEVKMKNEKRKILKFFLHF